MKGIILHGGHGTRLRPLTHTGPKQLLPIANKPMSEYCLESLRNAGITDIAVIIGGIGSNKVQEYYGDGKDFGVKLSYITQDFPKGIAHAVRLCKDFVGKEKFVVFLGDNIIQKDINEYVNDFVNSNDAASILLCEVDNPSQFGIAEIKNEKIIKLIEKPKNPKTNLAVTGIYFLTPIIFDLIDNLEPSWRNEFEIVDALQMLLDINKKIRYYMITDFWKDTGTPEDILQANKIILENMKSCSFGTNDDTVVIEGNVVIGEGTIIKNGSKIIGPVIIGKNCIVSDNSYIGPNTSVGDNTHLSYCTVKNSIIMSDCIIDCNIKIKNSIISSNSKISKIESNNEEKVFLLGEGTKINL
ncbi:glucose-1-phosphate thymidylyltransferase [Nitrosopumilus ureiphilus]|uniref:Glucose-1-phosphate thymidylyltransferase n=1 Tax=Nitrosopumilus ureiphilus TaxID=1470067 RepID=A0A7D5M488_9ARCH|nr:glucose-1-phosphate thymidylyltransferase [Nitrosopumilus ureiphilus]QLH05771.1 glucose-1-phosphate thymidylyltransferase [Nitrosopumilus ureiphilus]